MFLFTMDEKQKVLDELEIIELPKYIMDMSLREIRKYFGYETSDGIKNIIALKDRKEGSNDSHQNNQFCKKLPVLYTKIKTIESGSNENVLAIYSYISFTLSYPHKNIFSKIKRRSYIVLFCEYHFLYIESLSSHLKTYTITIK